GPVDSGSLPSFALLLAPLRSRGEFRCASCAVIRSLSAWGRAKRCPRAEAGALGRRRLRPSHPIREVWSAYSHATPKLKSWLTACRSKSRQLVGLSRGALNRRHVCEGASVAPGAGL